MVDCLLSEVLQMASSLNSAVAILVFLYNVTGTVVSKLTILIGALWFLEADKALATQIDNF